jgi:hypothetical protein
MKFPIWPLGSTCPISHELNVTIQFYHFMLEFNWNIYQRLVHMWTINLVASFVIAIMNEDIELYFELKLQVKVKAWKGLKKD